MSKRARRSLKYASLFLDLKDQCRYSVSDISRLLASPQDAQYKRVRACVSHYAKEKLSLLPDGKIQKGFRNRAVLTWFGWRWKSIVPWSQKAQLWANAVLERTQTFKSIQTNLPSLAALHQEILQHICKLKPCRFCSIPTMMKTAQRLAGQRMARYRKSQLLALHLKGWANDWRTCLHQSFLSPNGAFRGWQWWCCLPETVLSHHQKLKRLIAQYIQERTKRRSPLARRFTPRKKHVPFLSISDGLWHLSTTRNLKAPLQSAQGWRFPIFFFSIWLDCLLFLCSWLLLFHLQSDLTLYSQGFVSTQALEQPQVRPQPCSDYHCLKCGDK